MTMTAFVTALAALDVDGIRRAYVYPPLQISTADLPASFIRPPQSTYDPVSICDDTSDTFVCQFVVAIEPTGQSTQPANYEALITMIDNVNTTLKADWRNLGAMVTWQINAQDREPIILGQTPYWGVTATVTTRG
jgi:hypothetical protein